MFVLQYFVLCCSELGVVEIAFDFLGDGCRQVASTCLLKHMEDVWLWCSLVSREQKDIAELKLSCKLAKGDAGVRRPEA